MEANAVEIQLSLVPPDAVIYSIDTNVFLDIWCPPDSNIFSRHRMPELWEHIEKLVDEGRIIATREVYDELKDHAEEDLLEWLKHHKSMFIETDVAIVGHAKAIINDVYTTYKGGYKPDQKNAADPFVVAVALSRQAVVFTQEHRQDPHNPSEVNAPKIPTVCDSCDVDCVNLHEFIEREGFSIRMVKSEPVATHTAPVLKPAGV